MKKILFIAVASATFLISCSKNSNDDLAAAAAASAQQPSASFALPATESKEGTAVQFKNNSVNAVSYKWDFGNGSTSTEKEPSFTYNMCGAYDVKLTVTDLSGHVSESTQKLYVTCIFTSIPGQYAVHPALF